MRERELIAYADSAVPGKLRSVRRPRKMRRANQSAVIELVDNGRILFFLQALKNKLSLSILNNFG